MLSPLPEADLASRLILPEWPPRQLALKGSSLKIYIIDGYNLLWKFMPAQMKAGELEGGRARLEDKLIEFIALQGAARIILVYDGKGRGAPPSRERWGLQTCFTPGGITADERILDLAEEQFGQGNLFVVTSDLKDIGRRLGGTRATHMKSEAFIELLNGSLKRPGLRPTQGDGEKPPAPEGGEVDDWLEEFDLKD